MKIKRIAENVLEVKDSYTGNVVLVSYDTPVAVGHCDGLIEVTLKKHSKTTSKHISQFVTRNAGYIRHAPQAYFDKYLELL